MPQPDAARIFPAFGFLAQQNSVVLVLRFAAVVPMQHSFPIRISSPR